MLDIALPLKQYLLMNKLDTYKRAQIIRCLVDGNSIRATERITGVTKKAITRLLCEIGEVCRRYQDDTFRNLTCKRLQLDEIWSFCGSKEKNTKEEKKEQGWGDVWTWTAIDADTKLIPSWLMGNRDAVCATEFMQDLAARLKNRVQITSDGHRAYLVAVERTFGSDVDYAQLVKIYGKPIGKDSETRYSPPECIGIETKIIAGDPDADSHNHSPRDSHDHSPTPGLRVYKFLNGFNLQSNRVHVSFGKGGP